MKNVTKTLRLSAIALAVFGATGVQAVTTTALNQTAATDTTTTGGYGTAVSATGTFVIPQYAGGLVLTGVTFSASSPVMDGVASDSNSNFGNYATANAQLIGTYTLGGGTATGSSISSFSTTTAGGDLTPAITPYSATGGSVTGANLGSFITGSVTGNVTETIAVSKLTVTGTANPSLDLNSHQNTVTYNYVTQGHANGGIGNGTALPGIAANSLTDSFSGLYRTGAGSNTTASQTFSIGNGSGLFGMDIVSYTCAGADCGKFSITGNTFQDIAGGGFKTGSVNFLGAANAGNYSATFTFFVNDDNLAVGAGKNTGTGAGIETLTLNVAAAVVPEPESYAMLLAGLGVMGAVARRRKVRV